MTTSIKVNKYSEIEIKKLLLNKNSSELTVEEINAKNEYLAYPKLTIKNINIISQLLNISVNELLETENIDINSINFRNKKNDSMNEKISSILKLMVVSSKQLEVSGVNK
ncbi:MULTISPECIES: hypothetical protein [Staphylococcus]|uniref:hypothetical protein n=1 Tax=Staphylococcus TaxID=1279 RepID=UPI002DBE36FF|nr:MULTISPECIES: hypothetical protein [Staphylococcus]MEB7383481.1 hypothetical protein [Staphylococcus xylosus]MEB8335269.1 hypothetical protein [Staphylococcus saprophyticus]